MIAFVCKLYMLLCLGLSTNASPILTGLKTTSSDYQQSDSSHHEFFTQFPPNSNFGNMDTKFNLQSGTAVDQSLKSSPGITTTYRDQNGNLVTQVKKETYNKENGQSAHAFEIQESKQLPNGYSKSFKKEYSSSSVVGSQPSTFFQKPLNAEKYYNSEQISNGQFSQNYQGQSIPVNIGNIEVQSNFKSTVDQSLTNVPGVTTTFRDQNGNIVTQVKKEIVTNNDGQNGHAVEYEETKQLPNGYSKSFKKEYSSSSVVGSQPTTFVQKPLNAEKYYNSEQISNSQSNSYGQSFQNYQGQSIPANIGNIGVQSNFKSTVDQSLTNVPGVTSTFRDQNGNIVTQVKKEIVTNNDGQNGHAVEYEETKQLPNGYSKSFKKEYSLSSVVGSQPTTFVQKPLNAEKYYNSEQISNSQSNSYGQSFQNYQGQSIPANGGNIGVQSNYKSTVDQSLTNVPGVTSTFRDQNGNIVTQVKKEIVTNTDGQNGHVVEYEETKQLPNGYSKSFKKEYSSSSVVGSQPTTFVQKPLNAEKYYNSEQISNSQSNSYGQSFQNYQGQSIPANGGNIGVQSNFKTTVDQSLTNVPGVTSTFRDQNGNIVTQVKKEIVTNNDGQNGHITEFEETKQFPNGYSKSFKKEYSSSSVISARPTLIKDTTTEKNTYLPQKFTQGDTEKFNGYNTFFNNQKYTSEPNSPISSQVFNNKKQTESGQQSIDLHGYSTPSRIGQQSVDISNQYKPKKPSSQQFEKIESVSTQTQEEVGQQSVDLPGYSTTSQIGQQSVDISNQYTPKKTK
ncbi:uncharacterized protein LOC132940264 isoform X2 [Metopolophium dirhodum]|uniref:uncharacterized protein LOC132940264 isoform X2 n=1 Tax=Metopolophium dirhodum TaxID=44670 RepID=UPI0029904774|nr:uncharacterized protein LOC132940264 isoform X2 [Metopolophium dirhodum]